MSLLLWTLALLLALDVAWPWRGHILEWIDRKVVRVRKDEP